jgi:2-polyprenyl-6-methoxyphenol hydroxylase-like FAD-dependent oxidoreductase
MTPPNTYDIVIVGAGPAGLMLSTQLTRWGYKIKHIDNRPTPTVTGRADGIQPRSLDLLRNMGLKRAIMAREPAKVYEVSFWGPSRVGGGDKKRKRGIVRMGRARSCPEFIETRYPFTTLLHQGHIERVFLEDLRRNGVEVLRPWRIVDFGNNGDDETYPVTVDIEHVDGSATGRESLRAKYLFGGEGARSFIRQKLGIEIKYGDPISHVWGVMDGVVRTDFPDIKVSSSRCPQISGADSAIDEVHNPFRFRIHNGNSKRR